MNVKEAYNWALQNPNSVATIFASGFLSCSATDAYNLFQGIVSDGKVNSAFFSVGSPVIAYILSNFGMRLFSAFFHSDERRPRTKLSDFKRIRQLEKGLQEVQIPPIISRTQKTDYHTRDLVFELLSLFSFFDVSIKKETKISKNPVILWMQASKELEKDNFDESFDYIKLAVDSAEGKILPLRAKALSWNYTWSTWLMRTIYPAVPQAYVFSSAYAALTDPQKAWYYSELGRMVADEFNSPFRKEMYVCHALLASAQGRSDEGEAWKDAIRVASEGAEWDRLGESRSVVRVIKNGTFFKNTFLFKQKESLDAMLWERECYETIGNSVDSVTVPKVLYCSTEPENGKYTLAMRVLSGETLYEKLKKENYEAMPEVISALAQIHATFPTEKLNPINLEDRVKTGLQAMNLPDGIVRQIFTNYAPVVESLNASAWAWNKDAHPENWIIGEKIGVIDCESKNTSPVLCDLANLLEYDDFFTDEQKKGYIDSYIQRYNEKGGTIDETKSLRDYHNAVIHRMICFASAWSDSTRPSLHSKRSLALRKGAKAITALKNTHHEWYSTHSQQYDALESSLLLSANLMDAYTS